MAAVTAPVASDTHSPTLFSSSDVMRMIAKAKGLEGHDFLTLAPEECWVTLKEHTRTGVPTVYIGISLSWVEDISGPIVNLEVDAHKWEIKRITNDTPDDRGKRLRLFHDLAEGFADHTLVREIFAKANDGPGRLALKVKDLNLEIIEIRALFEETYSEEYGAIRRMAQSNCSPFDPAPYGEPLFIRDTELEEHLLLRQWWKQNSDWRNQLRGPLPPKRPRG